MIPTGSGAGLAAVQCRAERRAYAASAMSPRSSRTAAAHSTSSRSYSRRCPSVNTPPAPCHNSRIAAFSSAADRAEAGGGGMRTGYGHGLTPALRLPEQLRQPGSSQGETTPREFPGRTISKGHGRWRKNLKDHYPSSDHIPKIQHRRLGRGLDVRGVQGAAVRRSPAASADGGRGAARPQDGLRVLSVPLTCTNATPRATYTPPARHRTGRHPVMDGGPSRSFKASGSCQGVSAGTRTQPSVDRRPPALASIRHEVRVDPERDLRTAVPHPV